MCEDKVMKLHRCGYEIKINAEVEQGCSQNHEVVSTCFYLSLKFIELEQFWTALYDVSINSGGVVWCVALTRTWTVFGLRSRNKCRRWTYQQDSHIKSPEMLFYKHYHQRKDRTLKSIGIWSAVRHVLLQAPKTWIKLTSTFIDWHLIFPVLQTPWENKWQSACIISKHPSRASECCSCSTSVSLLIQQCPVNESKPVPLLTSSSDLVRMQEANSMCVHCWFAPPTPPSGSLH